MKFICNRIRK